MTEYEPGPGVAAAGLSRRHFLHGSALAAGGLAAASALAACGSSGPPGPRAGASLKAASAKPVYGGKLRVGTAFGGPTDSLDPGAANQGADYYRSNALFDALCYLDVNYKVQLQLAESMEPNAKGTAWTVRLRPGVKWHDGKPLTADDVIYTLKRDQKLQLVGTYATNVIDFAGLKKLDARTLRIPLTVARADYPLDLCAPLNIVPDGTTDFRHPIGTGPFRYVSFAPGRTSLFARNPDYWVSGRPYVDSLEITTIADPTSRVNALLAGQVDAIDQMAFASGRQYQETTAFQLIQTKSGNILPLTMACDIAPFNDVRVRQAMRLIADRPALVEAAQLGFGQVGNDIEGKGQPGYPASAAQRVQDLDQARSLLKAAGHDKLTVTLNTSALQPGMLESSTAYAQQAKAAGVNVIINNISPANYYGPQYLKYPFGVSGWADLPVEQFMASALVPGAPYNETHWRNPAFNALYNQARGTFDAATRDHLLVQAQDMLYNDGGYLIWGLTPNLDGYGKNVHLPPSAYLFEMGGANVFQDFWLE
jgi:peptide/nickel transport system substrate-binding protein